MFLAHRVSAAVVHYQTPDLLDEAVGSFCACYPHVPVAIVDNGSRDTSRETIEGLCRRHEHVSAILLEENRYHGPAMDLALRRLDSEFVFLLDSDTKTHGGGFLEKMVELCAVPDVYGAGKVVRVNRRGFANRSGTPVLVSAHMLIDRALYLELPPFVHHGLPALRNFQAAEKVGYRLVDYPVDEFVEHLGRGTAERYGYGLGWRGRVDYVLNKLGL